MASRKLVIEFVGDTAGLQKSTRKARDEVDGFERSAKSSSRGLATLGKAAAGAAVGVTGLAVVGSRLVKAYEESAKVSRQTEAVIKSTGAAAKVTAGDVADLSAAISTKSGIDDEAIQTGANLLLTFKNIRNEAGKGKDIFNQATQAAVDLSAAGFGSLDSASKQLGKALNDPVKGMTALGRAGVTFSADQKAAIAALMETGRASDRVKAQQLILREVMSQVGGSAAAQATPFMKLQVTLENLQETLGMYLAPAAEKAASELNRLLLQLQGGAEGSTKLKKVLDDIAATVRDMADAFRSAERAVRPVTSRLFPAVASAAAAVGGVFRGLARTVRAVFSGDIRGAFEGFKSTVANAMRYVLAVVRAQSAPFRAAGAAIGRAIVGGITGAFNAATGFVSNIGNSIRRWLNDATPFGDQVKVGPVRFRIPALARGGAIEGGQRGKDSVPALLMPGEHVLTAKEVQRMGGHGAVFAMRRQLGGGGQASGNRFSAGGLVTGMLARAKKYAGGPYDYGGGHGGFGRRGPRGGFDCSGYVSTILGPSVLGSPMAVRQPMAGALLSAKGPDDGPVVVGIRGSSGRNAHTMIRVGNQYFEAGGGGGARQVGGWNGSFDWFKPRGVAGARVTGNQDTARPRARRFTSGSVSASGNAAKRPTGYVMKNGKKVPTFGSSFGGSPNTSMAANPGGSFLRIPETSTDGGFALSGGTAAALAQGGADGTSPAVDNSRELLAAIRSELAAMNSRAAALGSGAEGALAKAVTLVVSGQVGGTVGLTGSAPGYGPGLHARY
jgi:hypothetical protein